MRRGAIILLVAVGGAFAPGEVVRGGGDAPQQGKAAEAARPVGAGGAGSAATSAPSELAWLGSLDDAYREALREQRPIFAVVGAAWCGPCHRLKDEMAKPEAKERLAAWTRVYIDADNAPDVARSLAAEALPALRVLTPAGATVASTEGYMPLDELGKWLDDAAKAAQAAMPPAEEFTGTAPPDDAATKKLIDALASAQPAIHEAAVRRLLPHANVAAPAVVDAFANGNLERRLALLDLLNEWHAPIADIDPWKPETITPQRLDALRKWAERAKAAGSSSATQPSPATQQASATTTDEIRADLAALLAAPNDAEAQGVRERLVRRGRELVEPQLRERLRAAATDRDRERLAALQLRLASTDRLALGWPGGFERLASTDSRTRHDALNDLAKRSTADDAPLLLELFASPDPLVRETSLRLLRAVGGDAAGNAANAALAKLLADPEPNIRAAVLKQLAEQPDRALTREVVKYVATERDVDLVVHAIRALRAARTKAARKCLLDLLEHENWRVRAEAAEALTDIQSQGGNIRFTTGADESAAAADDAGAPQVRAAMLKLLDDPDGYVVSRAILALEQFGDPSTSRQIFAAAERHPELLPELMNSLNKNPQLITGAGSYLQKLAKHETPSIRAAAVRAIGATAGDKPMDAGNGALVVGALGDDAEDVRVAAAQSLVALARQMRPQDGYVMRSKWLGFGQERVQVEPGQWLDDWRAGQGRPTWLAGAQSPLERMVAADTSSQNERTAAAVALAVIARDEVASPVLHDAASSGRADLVRQAADALGWLPWERRLELFNVLLAAHPPTTDLEYVARQFADVPDLRAADPLWSLVAPADATPDLAEAVLDALRTIYLGRNYYNAEQTLGAAQLKPVIETTKAKALATSASDVQRMVALSILINASADAAAETGAAIVTDTSASDAARADALQVQLMSLPRRDAERAAVAALSMPNGAAALRKVAVPFLAGGYDAIRQLRGSIYLYSTRAESISMTNQVVVVEPPKGLTIELVRPLLADADPDTAAYAGYLAATLGDRSGLDALLKQWRENAHTQLWTRPVYRAIAALNDDSLTPALAEVYQSIDKSNTFYLRDFYWTIRSMKGEQVLKLRRQIRDEVGMQQLQ